MEYVHLVHGHDFENTIYEELVVESACDIDHEGAVRQPWRVHHTHLPHIYTHAHVVILRPFSKFACVNWPMIRKGLLRNVAGGVFFLQYQRTSAIPDICTSTLTNGDEVLCGTQLLGSGIPSPIIAAAAATTHQKPVCQILSHYTMGCKRGGMHQLKPLQLQMSMSVMLNTRDQLCFRKMYERSPNSDGISRTHMDEDG